VARILRGASAGDRDANRYFRVIPLKRRGERVIDRFYQTNQRVILRQVSAEELRPLRAARFTAADPPKAVQAMRSLKPSFAQME